MEPRHRTGKAVRIAALAVTGIALYAWGIVSTRDLQAVPSEDVDLGEGLKGMWLWPEGEGPKPAVLFANGAASSLEYNLPLAIELAKHGVASFLFDFRGQGRSPGPFSPDVDLDIAIDYFRNHPRVDPARLGAAGHSMGGRLLCSRVEPFQAVVIFGMRPVPDDARILVAHSRFEFLFDTPKAQNLVVAPWSDHLSGPMDAVLLRHGVDWFGKHLGFDERHPVTEPARIGSRLVALIGGALVIAAGLLLVPQATPTIVRNSFIPPIYLWITGLGTFTFPILLIRRTRPMLRMFRVARWKPILLGAVFFCATYGLAVGFASWSFFNVILYPWKSGFFAIIAAVFVVILWHDQNIVHGDRMEQDEVRWSDLWRAAVAGATGRWVAATMMFLVVLALTGRPGTWMFLLALSVAAFWLEALAGALSIRMRHPLAGAVFLGLTWAWLVTVFLPG